jgi:ribosomal protein S27AE
MRAFLFLLMMLLCAGSILITGECLKFGALSGIITGLAVILFRPKNYCPKCGKRMPPLPDPNKVSDWWKGRWICPRCGAYVSKDERLIP